MRKSKVLLLIAGLVGLGAATQVDARGFRLGQVHNGAAVGADGDSRERHGRTADFPVYTLPESFVTRLLIQTCHP